MLFSKFPISDYYKDYIVDARTIVNTGKWWTAIVKIKLPAAKYPFVIIYRWQKVGGMWKVRSKFKFKNLNEINEVYTIIKEMFKSG